MKHRHPIALLLCVGLLAVSCNRHSAVETAAMEIYNRYASQSDQLTVAYVGDYRADGQVYNGVLLQAQTDEMWQWLCSEFGIVENTEDVRSALGRMMPQMDTVGSLRTASLVFGPQMTIGLDSVQMQELVIDAARGIVEQLTARSLDSAPMQFMVLDPEMVPQDSASIQQMIDAQQQIISLTRQHDDVGYVMTVDNGERTVWLFFYSSSMERDQLMRMVALPANMGFVPPQD
ncbi:MAG: hypothetical protein IJ760_01970 [Bacteroidales bacterium]|nr:hypothetical protein [Bacteroidales bacterium]